MGNRTIRECICGADIYQEKGFKDWFNVSDNQGTALYCYPDTEGPDGMALHEPMLFALTEENNPIGGLPEEQADIINATGA